MSTARVSPKTDCDCCAGIDAVTPARISNPPGLSQIAYRIGRHGDFVESMRARLSSADRPALAALTTREASDFTLAITDALATSLDVLSFYTERFANPYVAAERGIVDDVIDPADTRRKVIAGFDMLRSKREELPKRKHGNVPL